MVLVQTTSLQAAKDDFYLEVCRHLQQHSQGDYRYKAQLSSLVNEKDLIRACWTVLRSLRKDLQMKKVLQERPDLFAITVKKDDGHPWVALRAALAGYDFAGELPELPADFDQGVADAEDLAASLGCNSETEGPSLAHPPNRPVPLCPGIQWKGKAEIVRPPKRLKTGDQSDIYGHEFGKGGFFRDIIWTPEIAEQRKHAQKREWEMARALFNAVQSYDGEAKLASLAPDYHVCQLRKDPQFKYTKIVDFVRKYEDIFEVAPDPEEPGQFLVRIQPGGEAGLPDAEARLDSEISDLELLLPERIKDPQSDKERIQALRIELMHAVVSRGGKCTLEDLAQDPRVRRRREKINQAKALVGFLKLFPKNFSIDRDRDERFFVTIRDFAVSDQKVIEFLVKQNTVWNQSRDTLLKALQIVQSKRSWQAGPQVDHRPVAMPNHAPVVVPPRRFPVNKKLG